MGYVDGPRPGSSFTGCCCQCGLLVESGRVVAWWQRDLFSSFLFGPLCTLPPRVSDEMRTPLRVCSVGIILCIAQAALSNPDAVAPRTSQVVSWVSVSPSHEDDPASLHSPPISESGSPWSRRPLVAPVHTAKKEI